MNFEKASDVTRVVINEAQNEVRLKNRKGWTIQHNINKNNNFEYNLRWLNFCVKYFKARGVPVEFEV